MKTRLVPVDSLRLHAGSKLLPSMRPDEYKQLRESIRLYGMREPLEVIGDEVLDGAHRLRAAKEIGLTEVPVREVDLGGMWPERWMVEINVQRRHLTDDQRATIVARWAQEHPLPHPGVPHPTGVENLTGISAKQPALANSANLFNVPISRARRAAKLMRDDPALFERVHVGKERLSVAIRKRERQQIALQIAAEPAPLQEGPFRVIVADPPWPAEFELPYPTMAIEEICALDVARRAHDDAVLFLWCINSMIPEAFRVAEAWGFRPVTLLSWDKVRPGPGPWLRGQTEHAIFATRGKPPLPLKAPTTLITEEKREHSQKPEAFYKLVEEHFPGGRLELFGRTERPGWVLWNPDQTRFDREGAA